MNFVAWIFDIIQLTLRYLIPFWMALKITSSIDNFKSKNIVWNDTKIFIYKSFSPWDLFLRFKLLCQWRKSSSAIFIQLHSLLFNLITQAHLKPTPTRKKDFVYDGNDHFQIWVLIRNENTLKTFWYLQLN